MIHSVLQPMNEKGIKLPRAGRVRGGGLLGLDKTEASRCTCACHSMTGVYHVIPCCYLDKDQTDQWDIFSPAEYIPERK